MASIIARRSIGMSPLTRHIRASVHRSLASDAIGEYSPEERRKMYITNKDSPYALGKHRSNALELLNEMPVIEVDGDVAICDGGGGALGHPIEYIQLAHMEGQPNECKYCGLRYIKKGGGH